MVSFPASGETLVLFMQYIANRVKSSKTVLQYLSAVRKLHQLLGKSLRGFTYYPLTLIKLGLNRMTSHVTSQALPMTPELLEKIYPMLDFSQEKDAVFWCICVFAFFLLFRKSNLIPDKKFEFDESKQLKWSDLVFNGYNIVVGIRWAKNEQFNKDLMTYPLPILNSFLCPLKALRMVVSHQGAPDPSRHLFGLADGSSFTYNMFQSKLRLVLEAAGVVNFKNYSSHSFRRGGGQLSHTYAGYLPKL